MEGKVTQRLRQVMDRLEQATQRLEQATQRHEQARHQFEVIFDRYKGAFGVYQKAVARFLRQPTEEHRWAMGWTREIANHLRQVLMHFEQAGNQRKKTMLRRRHAMQKLRDEMDMLATLFA